MGVCEQVMAVLAERGPMNERGLLAGVGMFRIDAVRALDSLRGADLIQRTVPGGSTWALTEKGWAHAAEHLARATRPVTPGTPCPVHPAAYRTPACPVCKRGAR